MRSPCDVTEQLKAYFLFFFKSFFNMVYLLVLRIFHEVYKNFPSFYEYANYLFYYFFYIFFFFWSILPFCSYCKRFTGPFKNFNFMVPCVYRDVLVKLVIEIDFFFFLLIFLHTNLLVSFYVFYLI